MSNTMVIKILSRINIEQLKEEIGKEEVIRLLKQAMKQGEMIKKLQEQLILLTKLKNEKRRKEEVKRRKEE